MRGVWCQALSLPRPPVLWSRQPGFRDPCFPGAVGAGVGTQHLPHGVRPCRPALLFVGVAEGRPREGCLPSLCEGRLRSGAVPPPTARPLGGLLGSATHVLWARVCGCGGPTLSPWPACPVGDACRGGGGGPSPGQVACHRCEGRLVSGAVPPPVARPLERAARVPRPVCPGCGRCGRGDPAPAPQRAPLRAGVARCGGGGRASPGGGPPTIVRGVWCQALSLPRPPVLWSGQPGFRDPCVPGAVGAGVGPLHRNHSVRPCGLALLAVGVAEGRSRGGCLPPLCEGRLRSGAVPPPTARPLGGLSGSATHMLWARVCGCGGPTLSPWPACPVGAACRGVAGGPSPGEVACHRCEGRLVSGAVPPLTARPLERAARVPLPVCAGCGRCGCGVPAPVLQRAPLRAGVARCGGGGRASPVGVPSTIVRGVWGQALSLPRLPAQWAGCCGPPPTCCGRGCVGVGAQHCPLGLHALWGLRAAGLVGGGARGGWPATVVRGACCQALSLPRPPVL